LKKIPKTKICTKCGIRRKLEEYHIQKGGKFGHKTSCKKCTNTIYKQPYNSIRARKNQIKYQYGMSIEDYNILLNKQNNKCAICESKFVNNNKHKYFHIDHCHKTNIIRGLLCARCNVGLGYFNDDLNILKQAVYYLETSNSG